MSYNLDLLLSPKIDGCKTVGELQEKGCPVCQNKLYVEASMGFGSLWCHEHGIIHQWLPQNTRTRQRYASKKYKNHITGKTSKEWKRMIK